MDSTDLSRQRLKEFFREMLRIRVVEESLARIYAEQEMRCPTHFCIGQEAVPVAVCRCLGEEDTVMSTHRSHGHYLARGGSLEGMVAEMYGKSTGCASGKGGSMHLIDLDVNFLGATSIVAGTIPVAVGVAFASKLRRAASVSVVFFGDAATEEGLFYESVNFAVLHRLPVLFVCENNMYSTLSHIRNRQPPERKIFKVAASMGAASATVDGNDVEAVFGLATKAMEHVRGGNGPFLLEAHTYRHLEHCGPNYDHLEGLRPDEEFCAWQKLDPLARLQQTLLHDGVVTGEEIDLLRGSYGQEVAEAVTRAKSAPFPSPSELVSDVYAG